MNRKNTDAIEIAKSIIDAIIDETVPSYDSALRKYNLLVSSIGKKNEILWAKSEQSGYTRVDSVPNYRRINVQGTKNFIVVHQGCRELEDYIYKKKKVPYKPYVNVGSKEFRNKQSFYNHSADNLIYLNQEDFIRILRSVADRLFEQTTLIHTDLQQDLVLEKQNAQEESLDKVINILSKFPVVAKQLLIRHNNKETLVIEDEYDVQDLLHALLKLYFDDIRAEEWTPSYAGGSSRMDFLLKSEQIIIEVKKTRSKLGDKEIGEQLLIDIGKYSIHPDCKTLICFVYDPEAKIRNPMGLEKDLNEKSTEELRVITKIEP
ncbi:hypothetical protein Mpsy_3149 [Methanolobus psychrophilus R15]|nr:hypothetical protein Mpsy_3149 [Methanolobus psychrophilus R15]